MAKPVSAKAKTTQSISYRVERESTYEWKAIRLTIFSDGTFAEDAACKSDVLPIVLQKIGILMRQEGQVEFLKAKSESAPA